MLRKYIPGRIDMFSPCPLQENYLVYPIRRYATLYVDYYLPVVSRFARIVLSEEYHYSLDVAIVEAEYLV